MNRKTSWLSFHDTLNLRDGFSRASLDLVVGQGAERVGNDHRRELACAQGGALDLRLFGERRGDDDGGGHAACFQPDRVVQTARRAGPSIADGGDHHVVLGGDPIEQLGRCHA